MKTPHLGETVLYQLSDGKGGMIYNAAMIVKLLEGTAAVNLKVFADDNQHVDRIYEGIFPIDLNMGVPVRQQSNKWNSLESQL